MLGRWSAPWLAVVVGAVAVSFVGYYWAYRGIYRVEEGPRLHLRQMIAVVTGGFGGFLAHGGSALDDYALRAAGADERDAKNRVSALAGMEHGVLAVIGTVAGIVVLVEHRGAPPTDFSVPWAVIPIPGFALAFWLAERYRDRFQDRGGWRGKVGVSLTRFTSIVSFFFVRTKMAPQCSECWCSGSPTHLPCGRRSQHLALR